MPLDSRKYVHIDTDAIVRHIEHGDVFDFRRSELGQMAYALGRLTDVLALERIEQPGLQKSDRGTCWPRTGA